MHSLAFLSMTDILLTRVQYGISYCASKDSVPMIPKRTFIGTEEAEVGSYLSTGKKLQHS